MRQQKEMKYSMEDTGKVKNKELREREHAAEEAERRVGE
jgi:hypothetical protein